MHPFYGALHEPYVPVLVSCDYDVLYCVQYIAGNQFLQEMTDSPASHTQFPVLFENICETIKL